LIKPIDMDVQVYKSKRLFLLDAAGAVVTATLLSQLLARYEEVFGMPRATLFTLAAIASGFAVYSTLCYALTSTRWKPWLRGIAAANASYCLLTLGLLAYLHASLTWLGFAYFAGEILIVGTLAWWEFRVAASPDP
jgi:Zn-dependent membrane protease YugP